MRYLFSSCQSLESLDLSGFNTENVSSMVSMFSQCSSLRSLDLSSFNTSKVIDMNLMFYMCTNLESIDLSSFDTENLQQMARMFYSCTKLETLDLSSFATPNMTSMLSAFQNCKNLKKIYVTSAFTTDKVTEGPYALPDVLICPTITLIRRVWKWRTREREVISRLLLPVGCDGMRQPARSPSISVPRSPWAITSLLWVMEKSGMGYPCCRNSEGCLQSWFP